jgi:cellulose synthase/poly-beta-1,6-N-acetylglucosamine synthase-like glycosyltransferase
MDYIIYMSTMVFQLFVFLITAYYLVISIFGLKLKKEGENYDIPQKTFALIVAAHNEEMVIGQSVDSLRNLDYPEELYDIFVIADNCTDRTKLVAEQHGASVFERFNRSKRGKGYALEWMFNNIFNMEKNYDAVVVFDADNVASRNFLKEMNKKLKVGYSVVQGYIDSKNPHDSWITESYSISFWTANRLFQSSRAKLGLSNQIGGTGFCVETELLKEFGWGATCLTEDLEFTCKLVLSGHKVGWSHNAVVYDEKPLTLRQSWTQRKRWMQGFADVASRFLPRLLKKAFRDRDMVAFDCALYTIQPFVVIGLGLSVLLTTLQMNAEHGLGIFTLMDGITRLVNPKGLSELDGIVPMIWLSFSAFQFLLTPIVMVLEKKLSKRMLGFFTLYSLNIFVMYYLSTKLGRNVDLGIIESSTRYWLLLSAQSIYFLIFVGMLTSLDGKKSLKIFVWYLLYGIYTLSWIPITIQGIIDKNKKEWSHTKHTRQISISDIESVDNKSVA